MPGPILVALPAWDRLLPVTLCPGELAMAGSVPVDAPLWVLVCWSHPRSLLPLGQEKAGSDGILPFPQGRWGYLREHPHTSSLSDQLEQIGQQGPRQPQVPSIPILAETAQRGEGGPVSRAAVVWTFPGFFDSRQQISLQVCA